MAFSAAKRRFEPRSAPFSSLSRSKPGLRPLLHLLYFLLLIRRKSGREFLQLRMSGFLLRLLGHFDAGVVMFWHHLKERLVEVGISFSGEHRDVHLHLLVGCFVRDFLGRSVVPAREPAAHLFDLLLLA